MSKEYRTLTIGFTVKDCEDLPERDGEQMYADDVAEELATFIETGLRFWYATKGKDLLVTEPTL